MSALTSTSHLGKPKPHLPNGALDRYRYKFFATCKKSGCVSRLTNFETSRKQSTTDWIAQTQWLLPEWKKKLVRRLFAVTKQKYYNKTLTTTELCFKVGEKERIASSKLACRESYLPSTFTCSLLPTHSKTQRVIPEKFHEPKAVKVVVVDTTYSRHN